MLITVVINITKLMLLYIFPIIGFWLSIALVTKETLTSLPYRFLVTIVMMTGELNYEEKFRNDPSLSGTAHVL
jgi:hypothetical protein